MGKDYKSIAEWLLSEKGLNALEHDSFQLQGYDSMLSTGKDIHNLRSAIGHYATAAKNLGFGNVFITTDDEGSHIIFRPTDPKIHVNDSECPSLDISSVRDGFKIQNNMPTVNNPVLVRGAGGQVGLASSLSVGIDQAAERLKQYTAGWEKEARDLNSRAKKIRVTTNKTMNSVTHLNPSLYSHHQADEYNDSLNQTNITNLALEAQEMLKSQVLTGFYTQSLFNAHAKNGKLSGIGAPKNEKAFTRQVQEIMDAARGSKDFNSLNNYVRQHYPWIYSNVWEGDLANLYKKVAGHITQGGKKEGAPGLIGLAEADIAFKSFDNGGRKPKQNLQYLHRKATFGKNGSAATGITKLHTQGQYDLYKKKGRSIGQDLYGAGELTDADFQAVYADLIEKKAKEQSAGQWNKEKEQRFKQLSLEIATKGFGKDASLMSKTANKDFAGMTQESTLKGNVSQAEVNNIILQKLEARIRKQNGRKALDENVVKAEAEAALNKLMGSDDKKDRQSYEGMVKNALSHIYNLDSLTHITTFDTTKDENGKVNFGNINTRRKLDNHSFTARGGATSDFRSVITAIDDELLGLAFIKHGYRPKDVYQDENDPSKGLKMHIARQATPLSGKTIRSELKRKTEYILNHSTLNEEELEKRINETPLKGIIKLNSDGQWTIDNSLAQVKFLNKNNEGGLKTPFNMLQEIVRLGQSLGVYEKGEVFQLSKNAKGEDIVNQLKALPDEMELQVSSVDRYQGMGNQTKSGAKFTWSTLQSLEGTVGEMEALGGEYAKGIQPVRELIQNVSGQLARKATQYQKYTRNLGFLTQTFRNNATQAKTDLSQNKSVAMLTMDDISGLNTEVLSNYVTENGKTGVALGDNKDNIVEAFLQKKRKEKHDELLQNYTKDELKKLGIFSADDIQVGIDLGENLLGHTGEDGNFYSSGVVMLGLGSLGESKDNPLVMPDDIALNNNSIIRALQDYNNYMGSDRNKAGRIASEKILEATTKTATAIEQGSIYEKYHELTGSETMTGGDSSGYMLFRALNEASSGILKDIFGNDYETPSMIMSTKDAIAMYESRWQDKAERQKILNEYDKIFKGQGRISKGQKRDDIIKQLVSYYDINSKDYKKATLNTHAFNRSPTIKFASDILGGRLAFSSDENIANQGTLAIDADLAAASHGDMDGDRVAFFKAFTSGDGDAALEALLRYYDHLRENQKDIRAAEEEENSELAKINSVADLEQKRKEAVGKNSGAKGAGIYGNLLFGIQNILRDNSMSQGDAGANKAGAFVGNIAENIAHTLYQEGINIKNIKLQNGAEGYELQNGKQVSEEEVASYIKEIETLSGQSHTWDTLEGMTEFLKKTEALGITKANEVFKGEIIGNLNLKNIGSTSPELLLLEQIAQKAQENIAESYSKDSDEYKRITADVARIKQIKKGSATGINNLSRELAAAIITDKDFGVAKYFGASTPEGSFGQRIEDRYQYIPGHTNQFALMLRAANSEGFDELGQKKWKDLLEKRAAKKGASNYSSQYLDLVRAEKIGYTTSTSKRAKEVAYSSQYGIPTDTRELIKYVDQAIDGKSSGEEYLERQFGLGKNTKSLLLSAFGGTLAHELAEKYRNATYVNSQLKESDRKSQSQIIEELQKEFGNSDLVIQTGERLNKLFNYSDREQKQFFNDIFTKGLSNGIYVDNKIARNKGSVVGNEIPLTGFLSPNENKETAMVRQIADYIYTTVGEDGKVIMHIGDYKNVSGGSPSASNILQVKDYAHSLQTLHNDIRTSGAISASTYFGDTHKSIIAKGWQNRLQESAKFDVLSTGITEEDKNYKQEFRKAYELRYAQFEKLFKILQTSDIGFAAELISHNKDHTISTYDININDAELTNIYNGRYLTRGSEPLSEQEQEALVKNPNIVSSKDTEFAGTAAQFRSLYSKEFDALRSVSAEIASNEVNLQQLKILRDAESRELQPDLEKVAKYEEQIKQAENFKKDINKKPEEILKHAEELEDQLRSLQEQEESEENIQKILSLQKAIEEYKSSAAYRMASIRSGLANKKTVTNINNESIGISTSFLDAIQNQSSDKILQEGGAYNSELEARLAGEQYVTSIKGLRHLEEQIQDKTNLSKSKYLNEEQKSDLVRDVEALKQQRDRALENFHAIEAILKDSKGGWKSSTAQELYGAYHFDEKSQKAIAEKSRRKFEISEQQKGLTFFNKAYTVYKQKENLKNDIWKIEQELEKPTGLTENQRKLAEDELKNLKKQKRLLSKTMPEIKDIEGYTVEGDRAAKKKAQLEAEQWQLEQKEKGSNNKRGGYDRYDDGASPFALDPTIMRWMDRMVSGGLITMGITKIKKSVADLTKKAQQLDKVMTNLRIVTGSNGDDARNLIGKYSDLAKSLGVTTAEAASAAAEWARQGYDTAQTMDLVTASTYLSKLGMIDAATATKDLTSAMKGFKMEASQAMDIVDKLTALDVKAATTAGDIAEGLSQFANLATLNGVDIDQASAYVATIADVTQQSGTSVGQAMKTIMSRYSNVKAGAYNQLNLDSESGDSSENLNDVEKVLSKLGISMRDTNLEFKDFDEVLDEIAVKWDSLDNVSKKAIANAFAGIRQQESFLTLMENYDSYEKLLDTSRNSSGTAETKYQSYKESYEAAVNEFTAALEGFANSSQINKILISLTETGTWLIEALQKLIPYLPALISTFQNYKAMFQDSLFERVVRKGKDLADRRGYPQLLKEKKERLNKIKDRFKKKDKSDENKTKLQNEKKLQKEVKKTAKIKEDSEAKTRKSVKEEEKSKEKVATEAKLEEKSKKEVVSKGKEEKQNKDSVKQDSQAEKRASDAEVKNSKEELKDKQNGERIEEKIEEHRKDGEKSENNISNSKTSLDSSSKLQIASMIANTTMASLSQFATAATTHTYNGETVESSKSAQKMGSSVSAVVSMLPVIGSWLAPHIGEVVAAAVDKERDGANATTAAANNILNALTGFESAINSLEEAQKSGSQNEINEAIDLFKREIYNSDNEEYRKILEQYLGGGYHSIYDVLNDISDNTEKSAEAARELKLAQLRAQKAEIANKYSSQLYNSEQSRLNAYGNYDTSSGGSINSKATGHGVGTGIAVGLGGAAAGAALGYGAGVAALLALGVANFWNPVGWAIALGAVTGTVVGAIAGVQFGIEQAEEARERQEAQSAYNAMTSSEKILYANQAVEEAIKNGDQEQIAAAYSLLDATRATNALITQMLDEIDEISLQEAFVGAKVTNSSGTSQYLSDMSIAQLKNIGIDQIVEAYASQIEANGGLELYGLYQTDINGNKTLTNAGYEYALKALKSQNDNEVNAVLNGESYTLNEALSLKEKYGEQKWVMKILQNFADSLNSSIDGLDQLSKTMGELTLSETLMSTDELSTRISSLTEIFGNVSSSAGNMSSWMSGLISEFPELAAYMGDTTQLFKRLNTKIESLSAAYIDAQYKSISTNESVYDTIKSTFYEKLTDEEKEYLDSTNATTISSAVTAIQASNKLDANQKSNMISALSATIGEDYGITLVSQLEKDRYDDYVEYYSKVMDDEINNLNEQKEALQDINSQREYENKLVEAKLKLENASKEKKRIYRAGVGWVYEADQEAILEAQNNLEDVQNEKVISALDQQIELLEQQKEQVSSILDKINYEEMGKKFAEFVDTKLNGDSSAATVTAGITSGYSGTSVSGGEKVQEEAEKVNTDKIASLEAAEKAWSDVQTAATNYTNDPSADNAKSYNTALDAYYKAANVVKDSYEAQQSDFDNMETVTLNGQELNAWDISEGNLESHRLITGASFTLPYDGGYFTGYTNLEPSNKTEINNSILGDMKKKGRSMIYLPNSQTGIDPYTDERFQVTSDDTKLSDYAQRINKAGNHEFILVGHYGADEAVYVQNGQLKKMFNKKNTEGYMDWKKDKNLSYAWATDHDQYAKGTLDLHSSKNNALINELGTEAIVTPSGTITSLPSHTGIVPADITKNLWELGEVAPSIMRSLKTRFLPDTLQHNAVTTNNDESLNVETINITMSPDGSFDVDEFVNNLKARVALTRHSSK